MRVDTWSAVRLEPVYLSAQAWSAQIKPTPAQLEWGLSQSPNQMRRGISIHRRSNKQAANKSYAVRPSHHHIGPLLPLERHRERARENEGLSSAAGASDVYISPASTLSDSLGIPHILQLKNRVWMFSSQCGGVGEHNPKCLKPSRHMWHAGRSAWIIDHQTCQLFLSSLLLADEVNWSQVITETFLTRTVHTYTHTGRKFCQSSKVINKGLLSTLSNWLPCCRLPL